MRKIKELVFLKNLRGVGNASINKYYLSLVNQFYNFSDFVEYMKTHADKWSESEIEMAKTKAEAIYAKITADNMMSAITVFDDNYPVGLRSMRDNKPVIIYTYGDTSLLSEPGIAYVGTRNPSEYSRKVLNNMVMKTIELSGRVIVSGLALGCDKIAHESALRVNGKTVAVLPSGFNNITPYSNKYLANEIIKSGGCLISEYEPDAKVTKSTYVERDYIIAALADATVVVECGVKSGTMHTVNRAHEMNRRIACYLAKDLSKGQYDGNQYMMRNLYANGLSNTGELRNFLNELEEK